jgi:hypothetical protein
MQKSFVCPVLLLLALTGCGAGESEPGPGGVSADDANALDEAAEKLDTESARETE